MAESRERRDKSAGGDGAAGDSTGLAGRVVSAGRAIKSLGKKINGHWAWIDRVERYGVAAVALFVVLGWLGPEMSKFFADYRRQTSNHARTNAALISEGETRTKALVTQMGILDSQRALLQQQSAILERIYGEGEARTQAIMTQMDILRAQKVLLEQQGLVLERIYDESSTSNVLLEVQGEVSARIEDEQSKTRIAIEKLDAEIRKLHAKLLEEVGGEDTGENQEGA